MNQTNSSNCGPAIGLRTIIEQQTSKAVLYPNPTTGEVYIDVTNVDRIDIFDINGRRLAVKSANEVIGGLIDLSIYNQSILLLNVVDQQGINHHNKIIVIK